MQCTAIIETVIENTNEIVLDAANNVLVGPDGYFKIVIDEFDGNTIQAWHFEGPKGGASSNLADMSNGKHLDALININNSSVRDLFNEIAPTAILRFLPQ